MNVLLSCVLVGWKESHLYTYTPHESHKWTWIHPFAMLDAFYYAMHFDTNITSVAPVCAIASTCCFIYTLWTIHWRRISNNIYERYVLCSIIIILHALNVVYKMHKRHLHANTPTSGTYTIYESVDCLQYTHPSYAASHGALLHGFVFPTCIIRRICSISADICLIVHFICQHLIHTGGQDFDVAAEAAALRIGTMKLLA